MLAAEGPACASTMSAYQFPYMCVIYFQTKSSGSSLITALRLEARREKNKLVSEEEESFMSDALKKKQAGFHKLDLVVLEFKASCRDDTKNEQKAP